MRRIDIDKNTCETYSSISELLNTLDAREYVVARGDGYRRKGYRKSWCGYSTYADAVNAFINGKIENVKAMTIKTTATATARKPHITRDVVGYLPNVPATIIGLPKTMYARKNVRQVSPVVTLNIDVAQNAHTTINDMREYGRKCVSLIKALELQGKRVRVYACVCMNKDGERAVLRLLVKNEQSPLDIKRLSFPICDGAMLRVIGFEWYEKTELSYHDCWSYGYAVERGDRASVEFIKQCDKNAIYVNHYTDFRSLTF